MASLREYLKVERGLDDSLKNLENFVTNFDAQRDQSKIESRLGFLDSLFSRYSENRAKVEALQEQQAVVQGAAIDIAVLTQMNAANTEARLAFENRYFDARDFLTKHQVRTTAAVPAPLPPLPCQPPVSRLHLPAFKIPSFDGSVRNWLSFRDSFQSMIARDASLTPIDKFHYLLSVLTNEARTLVDSIDVTADNYEVAWEMLEQRYENKKIIARTLIDGVLDAEPIKKESYDALVGLIDTYERNLLQLKKIGLDTDGWSHLLAHLLYRRLDAETQRHWERYHASRDPPEYDDLLEFLRDHLATLQPLSSATLRGSDQRSEPNKHVPKSKFASTFTTTSTQNKSCPLCHTSPYHSPFKCDSFANQNPSQRLEAVKKAGLCLNCLSSSHLVRACPSSACRICSQRHHTMLHLRPANPSNEQESPQSLIHTAPHSQPTSSQTTRNPPNTHSQNHAVSSASGQSSTTTMPVVLHATAPSESSIVLLSTAVVKIADTHGNTMLARALLDCCSERNLLSERLAQKLKLHRRHDPLSLQGVGPDAANSKHSAIATIRSRCTDYAVDLKFHILSEIQPILPSNRPSVAHWDIFSSVELADPHFFVPNRIDVILGAEVYYQLLLEGFINLGPELPHLKQTVFGWIVSGKCSSSTSQPTTAATTLVCSISEKRNTRFGELESCHSDNTLSVEKWKCEEHFAATTTRNSTGRFIVSLPKKENTLDTLGDSCQIAHQRFLSLERRLHSKPTLMESCFAPLPEYLQLGNMALVDRSVQTTSPEAKIYSMPQHDIERLRVDASCTSDSGVLVHPADRSSQQILWRESLVDPICPYELRSRNYGRSTHTIASADLREDRNIFQLESPSASPVNTLGFRWQWKVAWDCPLNTRNLGSLSTVELDGALRRLVQLAQPIHDTGQLQRLHAGHQTTGATERPTFRPFRMRDLVHKPPAFQMFVVPATRRCRMGGGPMVPSQVKYPSVTCRSVFLRSKVICIIKNPGRTSTGPWTGAP